MQAVLVTTPAPGAPPAMVLDLGRQPSPDVIITYEGRSMVVFTCVARGTKETPPIYRECSHIEFPK